MTTPTGSPEPDPRSPAGFFDAGLVHLNYALKIAQQALVDHAAATLAATIATAHFAAAEAAYALIRERRAEARQRQRDDVTLSRSALELRRLAQHYGWVEQELNNIRMLYIDGHDGRARLEIMLRGGSPDQAYLNHEPISMRDVGRRFRIHGIDAGRTGVTVTDMRPASPGAGSET